MNLLIRPCRFIILIFQLQQCTAALSIGETIKEPKYYSSANCSVVSRFMEISSYLELVTIT